MCQADDEDRLEATDEQLSLLREWGVNEEELHGLSFEDAQEWIEELRARREDAGRIGRE